jgi:hypothetical protein
MAPKGLGGTPKGREIGFREAEIDRNGRIGFTPRNSYAQRASLRPVLNAIHRDSVQSKFGSQDQTLEDRGIVFYKTFISHNRPNIFSS